MKTKRNLIKLSIIMTIVSLITMITLQFRLYHLAGIYNSSINWLTNLREFVISTSSGLFAGFFATLLLSIREYKDVSRNTLQKIVKQYSEINDRLRDISWYIPPVPDEVLISYFQLKYSEYRTDWKSEFEWYTKMGIEIPKEIMELYEKDNKVIDDFRNAIWKSEPNYKIVSLKSEEQKNKYLDKRITEVENEIENGAKTFLDSLKPFRNYNLFGLLSTFDEVYFIGNNSLKRLLETVLLGYIGGDIDIIKDEIRKEFDEDVIFKAQMNRIYSLVLLNKTLLFRKDDDPKRYCIMSYYIASGLECIYSILYPKRKHKTITIDDYPINKHSIQEDSYKILFEYLMRN